MHAARGGGWLDWPPQLPGCRKVLRSPQAPWCPVLRECGTGVGLLYLVGPPPTVSANAAAVLTTTGSILERMAGSIDKDDDVCKLRVSLQSPPLLLPATATKLRDRANECRSPSLPPGLSPGLPPPVLRVYGALRFLAPDTLVGSFLEASTACP